MPRKNLFAILLIITGLASASDARAFDDLQDAVAAGVVQVRAYKGEELQTVVSGFVVNDQKAVLTSGHALRRADRITVALAAGGEETAARLVWRDDATDSALLEAPELTAAPVVFASDQLARGRAVASAWRQADGQLQIARGSIGAAPHSGQADVFYQHNAMITADGYGSPLLDECGRVVGINRKDPQDRLFFWSSIRADAPDKVVHAGASPDILALLSDKGVPHNADTDACAPREQTARAAQVEAESKATEAATAQAEAEAKAAEAAAAQAEAEAKAAREAEAAEQARREAEEAQQRVDLSEAEKAELRSQAEEAQRKAEEAQRQAEAKERAARESAATAEQAQTLVLELKRAEAEAKADAEQTREYLRLGGVAAAALALIVLLLFIWRSRVARKKVASAEEARRRAEAPPNPNSRPGWSFHAEGGGADSFYVSRELLEADDQGVRIGRSPDSCDYVVNAPEVSRQHCRVFLSGGRLMLEDLKSANGTRIGDRRLDAHAPDEIHDGDRITLGQAAFEVAHVAE